MKFLSLLLFLSLLIIYSSCKKDNKSIGGAPTETPSFTKFYFDCDTLPPSPPGGWKDSTLGDEYSIHYWTYNPSSKSEIIYADYSTRLYSYNFETKTRHFIDYYVQYPPSINAYGEIAYNKIDLSTYIGKTDGSGFREVPFSQYSMNPKWDYTGNFIYFAQGGICVKTDKDGNRIDSINYDSSKANTAISKTSDNYVIYENGSVFYINLLDNSKKFLFTEPLGFMQPCFSKDDAFIFWWDWSSKSMNKFDMRTKTKEVLQKSCESYFLTSPIISPNSNKLTMVCHRYRLINSSNKIYREDIPIEYDLKTKEWRQLHIKF